MWLFKTLKNGLLQRWYLLEEFGVLTYYRWKNGSVGPYQLKLKFAPRTPPHHNPHVGVPDMPAFSTSKRIQQYSRVHITKEDKWYMEWWSLENSETPAVMALQYTFYSIRVVLKLLIDHHHGSPLHHELDLEENGQA